MSPGADSGLSPALLAVNSNADYEKLCALDVLGLADSATGDQSAVYDEFKEQLVRSPERWYKTGLPWKGNCPPLPNNREGSLRRLNTLIRKLRKSDLLDEYDTVIREQPEEGVVEQAPAEVIGIEFFLPHRAVVRRNAETTQLRMVYDASARARESPVVEQLPPCWTSIAEQAVECRSKPIPSCGSGWRRSSCIPASANPRNRERSRTIPLDRGQESQAT